MTGKHTSGPWAIEAIFEDNDLSIVLDYEVPGEGSPIPIGHACVCENDGHIPRTKAEAEANARLMAAAPDLLDALLLAMQLHDTGEWCSPEKYRQMEAAVEKAMGQKAKSIRNVK